MITGTDNTGTVLSQDMLQHPHHDDMSEFNNFQSNLLGPKQNNNIQLYPFLGGPIIHPRVDDNVRVTRAHANGYDINVAYPRNRSVKIAPLDSNASNSISSGIVQGAVQSMI